MKVIYRAIDGAEFDTKHGCEAHETKLKNPLALLAVQDHEKLVLDDIAGLGVGKYASCFTIKFRDGSMIEITHHDINVFNADCTRTLASYTRVRDADLPEGE